MRKTIMRHHVKSVFRIGIVCGLMILLTGIPAPGSASEYLTMHGQGEDDAIKASVFRKLLQSAQNCIRSNLDELMIGAAEMMLTGPSMASVADMFKDVAAECVHARDAIKWLRSGKFKTPGDIKSNYFRRHGLDNYGKKGSLSAVARQRRLDPKNPVSANRNIAVVEYEVKGVRKYDVAVSQGSGLPGHSERVLMDNIPTDAKVTRIYSERYPCGGAGGCYEALSKNDRFRNATREYSFNQGNLAEKAEWEKMVSSGLPVPGDSALKFPKLPSF